jgi:hypothetical protein
MNVEASPSSFLLNIRKYLRIGFFDKFDCLLLQLDNCVELQGALAALFQCFSCGIKTAMGILELQSGTKTESGMGQGCSTTACAEIAIEKMQREA